MDVLKDLAGSMPLNSILGSKQKGNKLNPIDLANLIARNRASKSMGEKFQREADVGLKAGLSGIGLGAAIGGGGALSCGGGEEGGEHVVSEAMVPATSPRAVHSRSRAPSPRTKMSPPV